MEQEPRLTEEPTDRLTRLADEMQEPLEREENADVRGMVFLDDGQRGGIVMHGYEDPTEGITDLIGHLRAMFKAMGARLELVAIPNSPKGIDGIEDKS